MTPPLPSSGLGQRRPRESSRESWSISAPQRERASVWAPTGVPATILSLGVTARELRSGFSPSPQRSSPRSHVPGNGESPERFFSPLSLLQLQCRGSLSKAWVPEPPPWQRSANCRAADHLQRRSERVCVCVRVRRKEGHLFACACICVHSCVSERCLGWRRTGSTFTSASDPGLEVTVVVVPPDLSLGACRLICLEGRSDLRWDSDTCSPSPSPPKSD